MFSKLIIQNFIFSNFHNLSLHFSIRLIGDHRKLRLAMHRLIKLLRRRRRHHRRRRLRRRRHRFLRPQRSA